MQEREFKTACPDGYMSSQKRPTPCLCIGVGLGLVVALLSWGVGYTPSGHQLNDPIALGLAIGSLPRGLLYFDWVGLFQALFFSIGIGALSWLLVKTFARRKDLNLLSEEAQKTANVAILTSVAPVLIREIDAFQVLLWYGFATVFSAFFAKVTAKALNHYID